MPHITAICTSPKKGTVKTSVPRAELKKEWGIEGDAHAGDWHRQVSLLPSESIEGVRDQLPELADGAFAENLITAGIDLRKVSIGDRLVLGTGTVLEITQIGKECHTGCVIREVTGDCIMPREGIFARVLEGGTIEPGMPIELEMSSRAAS